MTAVSPSQSNHPKEHRTMSDRDASCAARLPDHLTGRLDDFKDFRTLIAASWSDPSDTATQDAIDAAGDRLDIPVHDESPDAISDDAQERLYEYPLAVSKSVVFRVELSTGGPADWLEVLCTQDDDVARYSVDRIVYHFADWFDHAERALNGDDFNAALDFVSHLIPDLS